MTTNEKLQEWLIIRAKVLSTKQSVKVLNALEVLERTNDHENPERDSMYELWKALKGIGYQTVVKTLERLEKDGIIYSEDVFRGKVKRKEYFWTLQGVLMLPELVPVEGIRVIKGGLVGLIQEFLGKYEDVVNYISETIEIDSETSHKLIRQIFLKHTITFFSWIRECVFPITGINDPDNHEFFREKMLAFTFELLLLPSLVKENLRFLGKDGYLTVTAKLWENRVAQVRDGIQSIEKGVPGGSQG